VTAEIDGESPSAIISNLMYVPGTETVTIKREWRILTFCHHLPECPRLQEDTFVEGGLRLAELLG
jgi:hypothetical protein